MAAGRNPYDELPYESGSHPQSHPDRLATIGTLFGMQPAPLASCRVLEIGCATGANLLPIAAAFPESRCVGVDLSASQIAVAQECSTALRLGNVTWLTADLGELGSSLGSFDYVIAHGVYSWVAEPLRRQLLELCAASLTPNGIAYVSYNTLPGASTREALRQVARLHAGTAAPSGETVARTRALFAFLQNGLANRNDAFAHLAGEELSGAQALADSHFAHEYLEAANDACYFDEFAARAAEHGLQFLAEAELQAMAASELPSPARAELRHFAGDLVQAEQYLDVLRNRAFRQTLLCRAGIELQRRIAPERIANFHVASSMRASANASEFVGNDGAIFRAEDSFTGAAFSALAAAWPQALHFPNLIAQASAESGIPASPALIRAFSLSLIAAHAASSALEFHSSPRLFTKEISAFPTASPLARWQAQHGPRVTNARHENIQLGPPERALLQQLDGTHSRESLTADQLLQHFANAALLTS